MKPKKLALCVSFVLSQSAIAASECRNIPTPDETNLFNATICIDGRTMSYSGNSAESLIDQFDEEQLKERFEGHYDKNTSTGTFIADFSGLEMRLSYPDANSPRMVFEVPSLGIKEIFKGDTRDESNDQLKDYLKKDGEKILKELVKQSSVSPIAGNPNSAQTIINDNDFNAGGGYSVDFQHKASTMGLSLELGSYEQDGKTVNAFSLPLGKSFSLGDGKEISIRAPITYVEVEGAKSYSVVLGLSYKQPVNERWALTPSINYGVAGSEDLGAAAQMASASLTSNLRLTKYGDYTVNMANMIGYFKTLPLEIGEYSADPGLTNQIIRNGFLTSAPISKNLAIDAFVTDTRILGDEVFMDQYNEIGFSVHTQETKGWKSFLNVGVKYLYGSSDVIDKGDINGFKLTLGYKF